MNQYKKIFCVAFVATAVLGNSCTKLLEEHPQSQIVPSFFTTPSGILGGISGVYNDIRSLWGTEGFSQQTVGGTDENIMGASNSAQQFFNYNGLTSSNLNGSFWNNAYQDINTLNGVLKFGAEAEIPAATKDLYLGQAKFLRAFWYFHLVQTFGDVPLHKEFITVASSADSRAPIADVYDLIIQDLTEASTQLSPKPTVAPFLGKPATQATALYLLAKAYLTRGWSSAAKPTDFQMAYTTAKGLIDNGLATYGLDLWQDYADAFKPANDYGKETLFVSDHSSDTKYGQYIPGSSGAPAQNLTPWFNRFNYPTLGINASVNGSGVLVTGGTAMMDRDVKNGRPYIRIRPNTIVQTSGPKTGKNYIFDEAFVNRANDSRFNNTFQLIWIANKVGVTGTRGTLTQNVDTAIWITDYDVPDAPQAYNGRPFKGIVIPPRLYSADWYPVVKKFDDVNRTGVNDPSTRPLVMYRFSDVYLIAAEAAFKGGGSMQQAADMLNVVRKRAAYRPSNTAQQNTDAATAMTIQATDVSLDLILAERSREFYAEWQRWWDLARTGTLLTRVTTWNTQAAPYIKDFHKLRPIPQDQIDRVTEGPKFPQNLGY
jgi:starch-binding outer membrane protein, SusD/RagB family